jgi:hypothetical protein
VELAFGRAADGAVLEDVSVADAGGAPPPVALEQQDGAAGREPVDDEALVAVAEDRRLTRK